MLMNCNHKKHILHLILQEDLCITDLDKKYRTDDGGHAVLLIGIDMASFICLKSLEKFWGISLIL